MNAGAIQCGAMIHVGNWSFGLNVDLYTIGVCIQCGLGPLQPRMFWSSTAGKFFYWNWQPVPWRFREYMKAEADANNAAHRDGGDYVERAKFRDTIAKQARAEGIEAAAVEVDEAADPAATFYLARKIRALAKETP